MTPNDENHQKPEEGSIRGGAATMVARIIAQIIQFAIFMVAVRVMGPEEFGVFTLVAAFIVIITQLATAGWPDYIMQWKGDETGPRQTLFVAMACGGGFAAIGYALGFHAPRVLNYDSVVALVQILSLTVFFSATGAAFSGLMNWRNRLSAAAFAELAGQVLNLIVAVWALLNGYGILALAYGRLAGAICWAIGGFAITRALPVFPKGWAQLREMAVFSWHVITTRLLITFRFYAATFIIGAFMGAAAVGYYRAAQRIIGAFEEIANEPTRILAWKLFRKARDQHGGTKAFGDLSQTFFIILTYATVPFFAGIALMAEDLTLGTLGADWAPAIPVLRILAIAAIAEAIAPTTIPILSLAGRARVMPRMMLLYSVIAITFISFAAPHGMIATAWSEVAAALVVFVINAWIMLRLAHIDWMGILRNCWPLLPAMVPTFLAPILLGRLDLIGEFPALVRFILLGLSMIVVFVPAILTFDKTLKRRIWQNP